MVKYSAVMKTRLLQMSLAALVGAALCAPAMAQDSDAPPAPPQDQQQQDSGYGGPGGPGRGAEMQQRMLEHMTKALNLTSDQVTQIKAIMAENQQKMMAMRNDSSVTGQARRAQMMAMREDEQTKIKSVLTDEQKVKYDAMRQKEMERRQEHRGGTENGADGDSSTPPSPPPSVN